MSFNHMKIFLEIVRTALNYYNHSNGMVQENLVTDTEGINVPPHTGADFKSIASMYNKRFDRLREEIENSIELEIATFEPKEEEAK